jgi:hypothetical protein
MEKGGKTRPKKGEDGNEKKDTVVRKKKEESRV